MLVLVSFGLVLLATILLVVGLLSDSGLTLIWLSILSSVSAGVVLFLASRVGRPRADVESGAPAPLPDPAEESSATDEATTVQPAAAEAGEIPGDAWAAGAPTSVDDDFPIADYDDLKVGEILPLLPQLFSDELDVVLAREEAGKKRSSVLNRLQELKRTGTDADREEAAGEAFEADADAEVTTTVDVVETAPVAAPAAEPAPAVSFDLGDDDDFEYFFPIADYDELTVAQIAPLLPKLELDELEDVREREVAGANRADLVAQIDRYLSGELEVEGWTEFDDVAAPAAPAPVVPARKAAAPARRAATPATKAAAKKAPVKKAAAAKKAAAPVKKAAAAKKAPVKKVAAVKKAAVAKKAAAPVKKAAAPVKKAAAAKKAPVKKAAAAKKAPAKKAAGR